jgi:hypothetical protein
MNSYFKQSEGGRLYGKTNTSTRVWCRVCTEWIKVICRQPDANISCITGEVSIKVVDCLPCLTIGWVHHDSVILTYTIFVPPNVSSGSF